MSRKISQDILLQQNYEFALAQQKSGPDRRKEQRQKLKPADQNLKTMFAKREDLNFPQILNIFKV